MEYARLGKTGLKVSRICLGCMSFGDPKWQPWVLNKEESMKILQRAFELGITFFDTADVYSNGQSEIILGEAIKKFAKSRDDVVIATKFFFPVDEENVGNLTLAPNSNAQQIASRNGSGSSRKRIFYAVERSLQRLQTDYIDLYQMHRWDYETPIEETMEALHDLVKMGKVRYIGMSSCYAWQFAKAQHIAKERGWTQFVSMQNLYNLLYREEEREMVPLCQDLGVGLIPWSPLARGALTHKEIGSTTRGSTDRYVQMYQNDSDAVIRQRVFELAEKKQVSAAQIALAWVLHKPGVSSPIIGTTKVEQLEELVAAVKVNLTKEELDYLEEHYKPRAISGLLPPPTK